MGRRSAGTVSGRTREIRKNGERTLVDVGQHATLCDGDVSQELVQLFIIADGELEVAGNDAGLLVVTSSVASQLEDFGGKVLENRREVDRSTWQRAVSVREIM